ncbi:MAG: PorT family protein [Muribaculaceae bacterium]|nr:PorT family protein [Muribaculaceae bacterium]MDE6575407.1 PorT family protein [Muribaculaceae bacterium]
MKILKYVISAFVALFLSISASANEKGHFGIRASYNTTTATNESVITGWGSGFSIGANYYSNLSKKIFFQTGLAFYIDNIRLDGTTDNKYNPRTFDGNIRTMGLSIPFDFGVKVLNSKPVSLGVYTGPKLFFNIDSKIICDYKYNSTSTHLNEDFTTSGMEVGWGLGIGADLFKKWHVNIEGVYNLSKFGETELFDSAKKTKLRRAGISVGIGYNF